MATWAGGPILVKVISTALVVVMASTLAEIVGPVWGALVASLPVSVGPAYVFLAMQHDAGFVAASALNSFAGNAATGGFLVTYALLARRLPFWGGMGSAIAVWLAAILVIRAVAWTPLSAAVLNLVVYGAGFAALSCGERPPPPASSGAAVRRWYDLPLRAAAVALFVAAIVSASAALGPASTGLATVFPITFISLIVIVQPRLGSTVTAIFAATALRAMLGFGLMLLTLHLAIGRLDTVLAFLLALAVSLIWSAGVVALRNAGAARYRIPR